MTTVHLMQPIKLYIYVSHIICLVVKTIPRSYATLFHACMHATEPIASVHTARLH